MANEILLKDGNGTSVLGGVLAGSGEIRMLRLNDANNGLEVSVLGLTPVTQGGAFFVSVNALPSLPAGGNFIGNVGIQALPPLAAGNNFIGNVGIGSLPAGNASIGSVAQSGNWHVVVDTMPDIHVSMPGLLAVTGNFYQNTQPVSLSVLPSLAAGVATIGAVNVNGTVPVSGNFYPATQPVSGTVTVGNNVSVTGTFFQATQPISVLALPLPSGAAQEAGNLATLVARTPVLGQSLMTAAIPVVIASNQTTLPVSGIFWQATQPVSGTVGVSGSVAVTGTFFQGTQPVSVASLPLPSGAALESGNLATILGRTPVLGQAAMASSVPVTISSNQTALPVSGTFWQGTQPVSIATLPSLPAGAATIGNVNIIGTVPVSGTFSISGTFNTTPPSLTNGQTAGLQMDTAGNLKVAGSFSSAGVKTPSDAYANPADGSDTLAMGMGWNGTTWDRLKSSLANGLVVDVSRVQGSVGVTGVFWQATQPVSIAAAVAVTGAFFQGTQPVSIAAMPSTPVTGTFYQATQPISAVALPLPAGAAIETGNLATLVARTPVLGQALMAASIPVSLASNQSAIGVTGTFWQTTQPVSIATMPTTAVTIASMPSTPVTGAFWQTTQPVSGSVSILGTVPVSGTFSVSGTYNTIPPTLTNGQTAPLQMDSDGSLIVRINDQLPAGVNTLGNVNIVGTVPVSGAFYQTTQPMSFGGLTTAGQATMAASIPVVIASNQSAVTIQGVQDNRVIGTITTNTSVIGPLAVTQRNVITVSINGTYAGVTFVIEASDDGSVYYPVQCIDNNSGRAASSWTPAPNASMSFDTAIGGYIYMRVRATAYTSGTANIGMTAQSFAYDPVVAAMVQDLQDTFITGAEAQSAASNNAMLAVAGTTGVDTVPAVGQATRSFICQVEGSAGISSGAITFQGSNDSVNWVTLPVMDLSVITGTVIQAAITIAASTHRFFGGKCLFRYIKCNISTVFAGGTIQAFTRLSTLDWVPPVQQVASLTSANFNATIAAIPAGGNLIGKTGIDQTTVGTTNMVVPGPSTLIGNSCINTNVNATGALVAVKAAAGNLYGMSFFNNTAAVVFLSFWNVVVGSVTLGTTAPTAIFVLPASGALTIPPGTMALLNSTTGISFAAVTAYNGASTASVTGSIFYK